MIVVRSSQLMAVETPGNNRTSGLITPALGTHDISVIRQIQQPGGQNPPHYHDREEALVLAAGRLQVTVADQQAELQPGDALLVPAGAIHQLAALGDQPAEWLLIASAGVRFFRADGEELFPEWAK
jgi:quercetin dioxygenase-like cupin family protein